MQYPLDLRFTIFSPAQQITVRDASGNSILFVKQKMFRFKEKIEVFSDSSQSKKLFEINADRILDFSANYRFPGADGSDWGSVRRHGMRSLWSAHDEVSLPRWRHNSSPGLDSPTGSHNLAQGCPGSSY